MMPSISRECNVPAEISCLWAVHVETILVRATVLDLVSYAHSPGADSCHVGDSVLQAWVEELNSVLACGRGPPMLHFALPVAKVADGDAPHARLLHVKNHLAAVLCRKVEFGSIGRRAVGQEAGPARRRHVCNIAEFGLCFVQRRTPRAVHLLVPSHDGADDDPVVAKGSALVIAAEVRGKLVGKVLRARWRVGGVEVGQGNLHQVHVLGLEALHENLGQVVAADLGPEGAPLRHEVGALGFDGNPRAPRHDGEEVRRHGCFSCCGAGHIVGSIDGFLNRSHEGGPSLRCIWLRRVRWFRWACSSLESSCDSVMTALITEPAFETRPTRVLRARMAMSLGSSLAFAAAWVLPYHQLVWNTKDPMLAS